MLRRIIRAHGWPQPVVEKEGFFVLNVGVTTLTERVPTATPGDDRGEEAKLRWGWVLESGVFC